MLDEDSIQKLGILFKGWVVVSGINRFLGIRKKGVCVREVWEREEG